MYAVKLCLYHGFKCLYPYNAVLLFQQILVSDKHTKTHTLIFSLILVLKALFFLDLYSYQYIVLAKHFD